MAPQGQNLVWSEVLCCPICSHIFSASRHAVNLACSHALCQPCLRKLRDHVCPLDQVAGEAVLEFLPTNRALMSIIGVDSPGMADLTKRGDVEGVFHAEDAPAMNVSDESLTAIASYLRRAESERGGSVWSEVLSRTIQRKTVGLLCIQLVEPSGRTRAMRYSRSIAERILSELLQASQNSTKLSSQLWTAVRARGCQFLGPGMQEDVLKLILLALSKGALIARKTLVLYVVQTMTEDYPQVSKTCVGHVVQLLYRASCFNVLKRDGESSLMQLKEEYRTYEALRREHDAQIVGMALEVGLRIAPEQWSSLLYGDSVHRSHMQSIIDKLQSPQSFSSGIEELAKTEPEGPLQEVTTELRFFERLPVAHEEDVCWAELADGLRHLRHIVSMYAEIVHKRNEARAAAITNAVRDGRRNSSSGQGGPRRPSVGDRSATLGAVAGTSSSASAPHGNTAFYQSNSVRAVRGYAQDCCEMREGGGSPPGQGELAYPPPLHLPPPLLRMAAPPGCMMAAGSATGSPAPCQPPQTIMMHGPAAAAYAPPMMLVPSEQHQQQMILMQPGPHVMIPVWTQQHRSQQQQQQHTPPHVSWLPQYSVDTSQGLDSGGGMYWRGGKGRSEISEAEQLHLRRNEIINRLGPLSLIDGEGGEEGDDAHVSYTVASSVLLDDRYQDLNPGGPSTIIELPNLPPGYTPVINSTTTSEETIGVISELALGDVAAGAAAATAKARAASFNNNTTTVRTVCPASFSCDVTTATVQSDSTTMHVRDTISEPLATPIIVPSSAEPGLQPSSESMALDASRLPMVIQPLYSITPEDPQDIVANTLDRILDVREKLTEADGASSTVVKTQLEVELEIASRQIDHLDPLTTHSCLLRELEEVDRKIEQIGCGVPSTTAH